MEGVSAFVLAGGLSSRMGTDKALLPCGNRNLLELALDKAKAVSPKPIIVGPGERYSRYADVIEDQFSGCGPLGGIHAALCATQTDLNLVLSVDMPFMSAAFLRWLVQVAESGKQLAVVPDAQGKLQPLCAAYRRPARCMIEQTLKMGDYKIGHIFPLLPTRYISEGELRAAGFSPDIFRNVNTPAEYRAVTGTLVEDPQRVTEG